VSYCNHLSSVGKLHVFIHIFIFSCKTAEPNETKLGRYDPWEEKIQICSNEVGPPWGGAIREYKKGVVDQSLK